MKTYAFKLPSGLIRNTVTAGDDDEPPVDWVEVPANTSPATHYFDGNVLTAFTEAQRDKLISLRPKWSTVFDLGAMDWVDSRGLPQYKQDKIVELKRAGLLRIQNRFPALTDFDQLMLVRELFLSIAPAARAPTTDWQWLIDTYSAGATAAAQVNAATTRAQVDAVVPLWPAL